MNHALDACAMIAYLRGEVGGDVVDRLLTISADTCYAHTLNLLGSPGETHLNFSLFLQASLGICRGILA